MLKSQIVQIQINRPYDEAYRIVSEAGELSALVART